MSRVGRKLLGRVMKASKDWELLRPGDRVMACLSGGKDSYTMLEMLREVQRRVPFDFSLVAVNLDQKQPGFPEHVLPDWLTREGYDYRIVEEDTYSVVKDKVPEGKTYCSLCSRLRRGILYTTARELGATRIALGHHRDDLVETLLLNLFYSGQLKTMPPKLVADEGDQVVIRPLAYCAESEVASYAEERGFPIIPCDLCGAQPDLQRDRVKELLAQLEAENPNVKANMLSAMGNVRTSHLLDRRLHVPGDLPTAEVGGTEAGAWGPDEPDEGTPPEGGGGTPDPGTLAPLEGLSLARSR